MRKILMFSMLLFMSSVAFAQNSVTGTVVNKKGEPLAGVSILVKGTTSGTSTDSEGKFSLNKPAGQTFVLAFSATGYKAIEKQYSTGDMLTGITITLDEDAQDLSAIVVTGSANPKKKIESSVAITTFSAKKLEQLAPLSTADLLQSVPGFVAEASGGEVGNNLFARGIPSAGAYEYVQIQEDGLPIFEDGALQFANIDNFHRADLTVKSVEAVRGGSAAIFASGAPGGIINFISNTGQNDIKGTIKLTGGSYGLFKTEFNAGGAFVKDKLFFNAGGFYRVDNGIRNPGYKANNGGQAKLNFTYKFDNGYARVFYKHLDDRNIFYQVTPFIKDGDKVKEYPGFNANYGTFASREMANIRVPQYGGGFFTANLEDGVHPVSDAIGGDFKYRLSDAVSVRNTFKSTVIKEDYNAIFAPSWMGNIMDQNSYATSVGVSPANAQFTYVTDNGAALPAGTMLKRADLWYINKNMSNFANNLDFSFKLKNADIDLGYYYSSWKSRHYWNWNSFLITASDEPRLVNLKDKSTNTNYTYNGISQITWLERDAQLQGDVNAIFANADIKASDRLNFNVGLRYDADTYKGFRDNATFNAANLGVLANNTADDKVTTIQGAPYTYWKYKLNELSFTAAADYKLNNSMAVYLRQSHGFRSPIEEAFYDAASSIDKLKNTKIDQTELGFKGALGKNVTLYASAFYMKLSNIAYTDIVAGGVSENKFADVNNIGLELEAITKFKRLNVTFNGTIQNPEYSNFKGTGFDYKGNVARRIPKIYFIVRPDYDITDKLNVYFKWSYFGKKYNDEANTYLLPEFSVFDAGVSYRMKNIRFGVDGSNIFNTIGLTEGDGTAPANGQVFLARAILGAAVRVGVTVNF